MAKLVSSRLIPLTGLATAWPIFLGGNVKIKMPDITATGVIAIAALAVGVVAAALLFWLVWRDWVTPTPLPPTMISSDYAHTLVGSNIPTQFTASGLPKGLSLNSSTGLITETGVTGDENAATQFITLTDPTLGPRMFWRLRIEQVP